MLRVHLDFLHYCIDIALTPLYQYLSVFCLLCLDLSVFISHINHKQLEGRDQTLFIPTRPRTKHSALSGHKNAVPFAQGTLPYSPPTYSPFNLVYYYLVRR